MIRFYNNQVRKDQELTEKIAWYRNKVCLPLLTNPLTLKEYAFWQRDELMRMAPRDQLEAEADRIVSSSQKYI